LRSWTTCDSPGAAGFRRLPVTPRKGGRTDNPLPPRPQRRPRGEGPRQAPSGAQKRYNGLGDIGGRRKRLALVIEGRQMNWSMNGTMM
jgi:hypothetical protein